MGLQVKWQKQEFKALLDNRAIRNYILLKAIKRLGLPYRQKENLYPLVTISGDPILYRDGVIHLKIRLMELEIEGRHIVISFDVLPLGKNKAVLRMLFLQEYNPKINWITGDVKIQNI